MKDVAQAQQKGIFVSDLERRTLKEIDMAVESTCGKEVLPAEVLDNLARIEDLVPVARDRFRGLILTWWYMGYGLVKVVEGRRSLEREEYIYGGGRTEGELRKAGVPVHNARPEEAKRSWCVPQASKHVQGLACDISLLDYGKEGQRLMVAVSDHFGVEWGGTWKVRDYGHFQVGGKK
jgi:hypothetical protein